MNIFWKGYTSSSVNSTRRRGWSPCGPGGFVVFSDFKIFSTSSFVIRKSVSSVLCSLLSNVGMFSRLSRVKTFVKKVLRTSALSTSVSVIVPDTQDLSLLNKSSSITWRTCRKLWDWP